MTRIHTIRNYAVMFWFLCIAAVLSLYFFAPNLFHDIFQVLFYRSPLLAYTIYFLMGCLRGFTLIPSTNLILLGLLFFPPLPLFLLTVAGILVSSVSVYYFSEFLRLDEFFERKYARRVKQIKTLLQKHELLVIVAWSLSPFFPTDVICYVCGALEINVKKFIAGILIGESIACAIYIFGGYYLLHSIR